ncbi:MAG: leucyl aminopeptidase [Malacoplasma sp.]|nr:leucyl aminopeptidase [Malacoplasma sp.]
MESLERKYVIFKALDVNDPLNSEKKKKYETLEKDNVIYFLVDKNDLDLPRIDDYIRRVTSGFKKDIEVDLKSFIEVFALTSESEIENLLTVLVVAFRFNQKIPFTMKQKVDPGYGLKYTVSEKYKDIIGKAIVISDAQYFCRNLQDRPSSQIYPESFVEEVKKLFKDVADKVRISVLDKQELKKEGMNLLLGVNAGSIREPRLLCIEYSNNPTSNEKYAYVGKGITFDSGGMNIKTMSFMRWMKFDMSGAASVMAAVYALAKNDIKTNVVAIGALTENLPGATAIRPDDIIVSHSGKTVEIDNTDAEGRLVLADALSYAVKKYGATKLVDIATLTGAMMVSLGDTYSGVWATDDKDWKVFKKTAYESGEYVWRLPLHEDYLKQLDSKVADIANCNSNDRRAGSSSAACFLVEFTHGVNYIHLDVAMTTDVKNMGQGTLIKTLYNFAKTQN